MEEEEEEEEEEDDDEGKRGGYMADETRMWKYHSTEYGGVRKSTFRVKLRSERELVWQKYS